MRIDDVSDPLNPIPLFEPENGAFAPHRTGLKPPGAMAATRTAYWKTTPDRDKRKIGSREWVVLPLELGDGARLHEVRCQYEGESEAWTPHLLGAGMFLIGLLLLQLPWSTLTRFEAMKEDIERVTRLKRAAEAGNAAKSAFLATMTHEVGPTMTGRGGGVGGREWKRLVLCTLYFVLCALYLVLCTLYFVPCTLYSVLCTL